MDEQRVAGDIMCMVEKAWRDYNLEIERIADFAFLKIVKPFLDQHGTTHTAGMGTYYLGHNKMQVDPKSLPQYIQDILDMEVPGMPADSLGSIMGG